MPQFRDVWSLPSAVIATIGLLSSCPAPLRAQTLDTDVPTTSASPASRPTARQEGGLDTDAVAGNQPLLVSPGIVVDRRDNVQGGVSFLDVREPDPASGPAPTPVTIPIPIPQSDQPRVADLPDPGPEPIPLKRPRVLDTAKLQSGDTIVSLFGIEGLPGEAAQGLQTFIGTGSLTCQSKADTAFVCLMADGTDVALVALVNGAAKTKPDAPPGYREQELAAQNTRRGVWSSLPPPPEAVSSPIVKNTGILVAGGKTYALVGVEGFASPYAEQLQSYIGANGNAVTCSLQGAGPLFVCLMPDGTDVAKAALVNGAARVSSDAPDAYRSQQLEAVNNRRGYWANVSDTVLTAALIPRQTVTRYVTVPGDDGLDGLRYVGGAPVMDFGGETSFLSYGGNGLGWGYYDRGRRWHSAPDRFVQHMNRYHPMGVGLGGRNFAGRGFGGPMARPAPMMGGNFGGSRMGGSFVRPPPMASFGGFHPGGMGAAPQMRTAIAGPRPAMGGGGRHR